MPSAVTVLPLRSLQLFTDGSLEAITQSCEFMPVIATTGAPEAIRLIAACEDVVPTATSPVSAAFAVSEPRWNQRKLTSTPAAFQKPMASPTSTYVLEKIGGRPIAETESLTASAAVARSGPRIATADSASIAPSSAFLGTKPRPFVVRML